MDVRRKVVLVDVGLGVVWILMGLLYGGRAVAEHWWIVLLLALAMAGASWAGDHDAVGGWTTVIGVVAFGAAIMAVGFTAGPDLVSTVVIPLVLVGLGVGIVPYRLYYGVVRPVPAGRMDGERERST